MSVADISKLLYVASIIIWILPAIRHYKTEFFDFFLILALIDPIALVYGLITRTSLPMWLTVLFAYLLIISLLSEEKIKDLKYFLIVIPFLFVVAIPFLSKKYFFIILLVENVFLFLFFLKFLITDYVSNNKLKFFFFMLVFYELTVILKIFNLIIGFADAYGFYIVTSIAQIIFGLFFSIVREDESGVII
jgi:hypothetical protein